MKAPKISHTALFEKPDSAHRMDSTGSLKPGAATWAGVNGRPRTPTSATPKKPIAAEAIGSETVEGEIQLTTAFRPGVRLAVPGSKARVSLPLEFCVKDNGSGVPEDLMPHLFDPFVTTKPSGSGLGLALVAKIVGDHGGIIECESQPRRTIFRVLMPIYSGDGDIAENALPAHP